MKIAFFAYESRNLNTYPSLVNAVRLLVKAGHSVDLYLPSSMATDIIFDNCRIIFVSEPDPYEYVSSSVRLVNNLECPYVLFFACYIEGLIVSEILSRQSITAIPIVYFSMELIYKDYPFRLITNILNPNKLLADFVRPLLCSIKMNDCNIMTLRRLMSASLKQIAYSLLVLWSWLRLTYSGGNNILFSIVSDHMRAKVLKEEFLFVDRIIYVPEAGYIGYNDDNSFFAFERFGISKNKKILLYTGGLERGFDLSLLDASKELGEEYILFCNVYSRDGYVQEILPIYAEEIDAGKLFFQTSNLDENEYDALVRSIHIGIVWYPVPSPMNPNMYYLGYSSGKLNKFLSCGKPVVCSDGIYGYKELIEGNGLGRICTSVGEFAVSVTEIESDYGRIVQNIKSYYLEHIDFEKCFRAVLEVIGKIETTI